LNGFGLVGEESVSVSEYPPASHHAIVTVDMADFTNPARTEMHRAIMVKALYEILERAFDEANIHWGSCDTEDRGDGLLILVDPKVPKEFIADRLPHRLVAGLLRHNALYAAEAAIRLRVAIHFGEVRVGSKGKVGDAINLACRLLEVPDVKAELAQSGGMLALIASDAFYNEVIAVDPGMGPEFFHKVSVDVKWAQGEAWLQVFGSGPTPAEESRTLWVFPPAELDRLRELLNGVRVPRLSVLVSRATGPGVRLTEHNTTAWEAVEYVLDFNAWSDGVPPALKLVEMISTEVGDALAVALRNWTDTQAHRLRLIPAIGRIRDSAARLTADARLYLTIAVRHDGVDPQRFVVSYWQQDDPTDWPPPPGESRDVSFTELEREVDKLVLAAEIAWSAFQGEAVIEFILPRALLTLPVDRWRKEHASGDPRPLSIDYPIVIRSMERLYCRHWHRAWSRRWTTLRRDPAAARVYFARAGVENESFYVDVELKKPEYVAMVLSAAPTPIPAERDELSTALRSGLPAVLWSRTESALSMLLTLVGQLTEQGLDDLPFHAQSARQRALAGLVDDPEASELINQLVVLWDDPSRPINLDQPPQRWQPEGGNRR
jgi:class 3 adenylate cyclase